MENRIEKAKENFSSGYNCAQAVFAAFCEAYGLEKEMGAKVAMGFGSGMGRLGNTCGAVTGAYMTIGLLGEGKERTYALVQEFDRLFRERNGSTNCKELLGVDLKSGAPGVGGRVAGVCPGLVQDAAEILERLIQ